MITLNVLVLLRYDKFELGKHFVEVVFLARGRCGGSLRVRGSFATRIRAGRLVFLARSRFVLARVHDEHGGAAGEDDPHQRAHPKLAHLPQLERWLLAALIVACTGSHIVSGEETPNRVSPLRTTCRVASTNANRALRIFASGTMNCSAL